MWPYRSINSGVDSGLHRGFTSVAGRGRGRGRSRASASGGGGGGGDLGLVFGPDGVLQGSGLDVQSGQKVFLLLGLLLGRVSVVRG